jgi:hypothetical protein
MKTITSDKTGPTGFRNWPSRDIDFLKERAMLAWREVGIHPKGCKFRCVHGTLRNEDASTCKLCECGITVQVFSYGFLLNYPDGSTDMLMMLPYEFLPWDFKADMNEDPHSHHRNRALFLDFIKEHPGTRDTSEWGNELPVHLFDGGDVS